MSLCVGASKAENRIGFSGYSHHHGLFSSYAVHALGRERTICSGGDLSLFAFFESPGVGAPIMSRKMDCGGDCDVPCCPEIPPVYAWVIGCLRSVCASCSVRGCRGCANEISFGLWASNHGWTLRQISMSDSPCHCQCRCPCRCPASLHFSHLEIWIVE